MMLCYQHTINMTSLFFPLDFFLRFDCGNDSWMCVGIMKRSFFHVENDDGNIQRTRSSRAHRIDSLIHSQTNATYENDEQQKNEWNKEYNDLCEQKAMYAHSSTPTKSYLPAFFFSLLTLTASL